MAPDKVQNGAQCYFTKSDGRLSMSKFLVKAVCTLFVPFAFSHFHKSSPTLLQEICFLVFCMPNEWNEHVLVFWCKSCGILVFWWIWMLSFLLNQIWIGIDDILLNFFTTFGSVLGLQVTALIRGSEIRWDCLFCLCKCWALSMTNETSLRYCVSLSSKLQNCLDIHWSNRFSWLIIVIPYVFLITMSTVNHYWYV